MRVRKSKIDKIEDKLIETGVEYKKVMLYVPKPRTITAIMIGLVLATTGFVYHWGRLGITDFRGQASYIVVLTIVNMELVRLLIYLGIQATHSSCVILTREYLYNGTEKMEYTSISITENNVMRILTSDTDSIMEISVKGNHKYRYCLTGGVMSNKHKLSDLVEHIV